MSCINLKNKHFNLNIIDRWSSSMLNDVWTERLIFSLNVRSWNRLWMGFILEGTFYIALLMSIVEINKSIFNFFRKFLLNKYKNNWKLCIFFLSDHRKMVGSDILFYNRVCNKLQPWKKRYNSYNFQGFPTYKKIKILTLVFSKLTM